MMLTDFTLNEEYWDNFALKETDIEFINNHLLELETPLSPHNLIAVLIAERIQHERQTAEEQKITGSRVYIPEETYEAGESLIFPAMEWQTAKVLGVRPGMSITPEEFEVIEVEFQNGEIREFATGLEQHILNNPVEEDIDDPLLIPEKVLETYGNILAERLISNLSKNPDFVYIAGNWFPKTLIVDVNLGNLNLAEAALDMEGGGPMRTAELITHVGLPEGVNSHLAEFSLDMALQEDQRFDEVGPAGEVAWFLKREEPGGVQKTPLYLRYEPFDYDENVLTDQMLELSSRLDDEHSPLGEYTADVNEVEIRLIYPHWRTGTLPLSSRMSKLFPTAYEAPRIRFILIDGKTGEKFPGWVVRLERYVYGLGDWYKQKGLMPGSYIRLQRGTQPGEVIVDVESHRSAKEWVRTALVGADGGIVYATLKQPVSTTFDERMMIAMPKEINALDTAWEQRQGNPHPLEEVVVQKMRELAKLNPQSHVHASELYSALNATLRCPPEPIMALLASRPWFVHVGDLHFRIEESENGKE
ncbi:MAG: hypothetical protein FVQ83_07325 [Chloroflexi bacterium]|nr:hypothetical protein [Chloroflexota bacterium]